MCSEFRDVSRARKLLFVLAPHGSFSQVSGLIFSFSHFAHFSRFPFSLSPFSFFPFFLFSWSPFLFIIYHLSYIDFPFSTYTYTFTFLSHFFNPITLQEKGERSNGSTFRSNAYPTSAGCIFVQLLYMYPLHIVRVYSVHLAFLLFHSRIFLLRGSTLIGHFFFFLKRGESNAEGAGSREPIVEITEMLLLL